MNTPFLRTPYNYDMNQASDETGLDCTKLPPGEPLHRTQQQFKDECDINTIVERFHLTGEIPQVLQLPTYGDFTGIFDFQTAMNVVREAQESFMSMPAKIRARFNNDPQQFLEFCEDKENLDEARKLGILREATPDQPTGETNGQVPSRPPQGGTQTAAGTSGTTTNQTTPSPTQGAG